MLTTLLVQAATDSIPNQRRKQPQWCSHLGHGRDPYLSAELALQRLDRCTRSHQGLDPWNQGLDPWTLRNDRLGCF